MADQKNKDSQDREANGSVSAAEEAAAIFRAAEEQARRASTPYQTATPSSLSSAEARSNTDGGPYEDEDDSEYEYEDDAYEDDEYEDDLEEDEPGLEIGESDVALKHSPNEIRFINRTNLDETDVRRLVDRIFDGRKGVQGYRIFLLIFSALVVFYSIYNIIRGLTQGPITYVMTGGFLLVMAVVMFYMGYKGVVNQTYKRTLKNAQNFMTVRTYHFYDTDFSQTTEAQSYSVTWEEVASFTEDEASFYIIIGQSYAIVHKSGFTMGDEESFRTFLESKAERRTEKKRRF